MKPVQMICLFLTLFIVHNTFAVNLFNDTMYRAWIADRRAYLPGDVLTVIVMETSNAQTGADLASGKAIKTALEANYNRDKYEVGLGLRGHGKTEAKTGRHGKIKAALTVRIKEAFPNRTYAIEGYQRITINGEQQRICLNGIVREDDISAQNTVLSTRLADAHITYAGNGSVSDAQRHNFAYKFLSFMGLV